MAGQPGGQMPMQGLQDQSGDWTGQDYTGSGYRECSLVPRKTSVASLNGIPT